MRNRNRDLASVRSVKHKVAAGVLLLSVTLCGLITHGTFNVATADTGDDKDVSSISTPFQTVSQLFSNEVKNDHSMQDSSWRAVRMRVTGYCPCRRCCGRYSDGITASGHRIERDDEFVAADKRHPFGTRVIIPGYNNAKPVQVLDRGGTIRGDRLDVFFNSHREAREWGTRYLAVKVQRLP